MKPVKKEKQETIWLLVYTKAKEEKKANDNLNNQGFKTFLPLIAPSNKSGKFKYLVPVFPRYLFVQINLKTDNWTSIKSSYGVSHIVMFSEKFTPISNNIIKLIQNKLDESGIYKEEVATVNYQTGDQVSIKEGSFEGIEAIFLSKKPKDRVRLLLKLINTSIMAEMPISNIENKEVVKNFKF
tara:strand:+ start:71 stop:619 length:549 start_codon:yes stop_codon:yes gene_type:complete